MIELLNKLEMNFLVGSYRYKSIVIIRNKFIPHKVERGEEEQEDEE